MTLITQRDISDITGDNLYLRRWSLWLPFGWSIKLHKIVRADDDRCQHNHPWLMIRIILVGGYIENRGTCSVTLKPWRPWIPWRIYVTPSKFKHRIAYLLKESSWSLIICGPKVREWGFFTKEGWMHWKQFVHEVGSKRIMWCDDERILNDE